MEEVGVGKGGSRGGGEGETRAGKIYITHET